MVAINPDVETGSGGLDIYDDIIKALEENGELDGKQFRRLVLFALVDLGRGRRDSRACRDGIAQVNKRIDKLEKYSILLLAHRHPKISISIGAVMGLFVIAVVSHLELWFWLKEVIEGWLEVPIP